jgi:hypothetical protein
VHDPQPKNIVGISLPDAVDQEQDEPDSSMWAWTNRKLSFPKRSIAVSRAPGE